MPDAEHEDGQDRVLDLMDDPVVTGPHPPLTRATDELLRCRRTTLFGEEFDDCLDPAANLWIGLSQLALSSWGS